MNTVERKTLFKEAARYADHYLGSEPVPPLQAYAIDLQAKMQRVLGNREEAEKLGQQASGIDPFYSNASGAPGANLFTRPGKVAPFHQYFFRFI
ncbi:MAG: hypothetical protein ACP5I4_10035 [Oceanipulchritudo sp.]